MDEMEAKDADKKLAIVTKRIRRELDDVIVAATSFAITWTRGDLVETAVKMLSAIEEEAKLEVAQQYVRRKSVA